MMGGKQPSCLPGGKALRRVQCSGNIFAGGYGVRSIFLTAQQLEKSIAVGLQAVYPEGGTGKIIGLLAQLFGQQGTVISQPAGDQPVRQRMADSQEGNRLLFRVGEQGFWFCSQVGSQYPVDESFTSRDFTLGQFNGFRNHGIRGSSAEKSQLVEGQAQKISGFRVRTFFALGQPVNDPVQTPLPLDGAGYQVGNQGSTAVVKISSMAVKALFQTAVNAG